MLLLLAAACGGGAAPAGFQGEVSPEWFDTFDELGLTTEERDCVLAGFADRGVDLANFGPNDGYTPGIGGEVFASCIQDPARQEAVLGQVDVVGAVTELTPEEFAAMRESAVGGCRAEGSVDEDACICLIHGFLPTPDVAAERVAWLVDPVASADPDHPLTIEFEALAESCLGGN